MDPLRPAIGLTSPRLISSPGPYPNFPFGPTCNSLGPRDKLYLRNFPCPAHYAEPEIRIYNRENRNANLQLPEQVPCIQGLLISWPACCEESQREVIIDAVLKLSVENLAGLRNLHLF